MWQVAVAAAVAGSGLIAKHIFSPKTNINQPQQQQQEEEEESNECDGVFRFSSSGSPSSSKKFRVARKKVGCFDDNSNNASVWQKKNKKNGGKKVTVSLKRRKICRNKFNSSLSKGATTSLFSNLPFNEANTKIEDCSSFGWGLGLGMICMMSAGKAEISKLSSTIDETAKAVNELKSELKHKSVPSDQLLSFGDTRNTLDTVQKPMVVQANNESCLLSKYPIDTKLSSRLGDSEYASSVLTEEHQNEGTEMDQLEAELEFELQKLPWCTTKTSKHEGNTQMEMQAVNRNSAAYHSVGVHPAELGNKLSTLLIEQQETHISELESELSSAYSKLQEKEAELKTLKECVKRLTEFSLSTVSDEETEVLKEELGELDRNTLVSPVNAAVGKKRAMHLC